MKPKCPLCQSTRVDGRYAAMWVKHCPVQTCHDCGHKFNVNMVTGEVIKREVSK